MPVVPSQGVERVAPISPSFENAPETGKERIEQRAEVPASPVLPPPIIPQAMPVPPAPVSQSTPVPTATDDLPLVANDDDLIEKDWVDKAKKIIIETKDDPYRREQEVSKLQADYLRKRYGRELGASQ